MIRPENQSLRSELEKSEFAAGDSTLADGKAVSVTFLETFLHRLKLFALMKQENPRFALSEDEVRSLDSQLDSPDTEIRKGALERIEELMGLKELAKAKAPELTALGLVDIGKLDSGFREKAVRVDEILARAHADTSVVAEDQLEEVFTFLQEIRFGLGEKKLGVGVDRAAGFEYLEKQLDLLKHRREVRKFQLAGSDFRTDPAKLNKEDFRDEPQDGDLLRIRVNKRANSSDELRAFKARVRSELIEDGSQDALKALGGKELLQRLQEVSTWLSRMRELYGDVWRGREQFDDTRHLLLIVEDKYREALIAKIEEEVKSRNLSLGKEYISSATRKVLETNYRIKGTSRYAFDPEKGYEQFAGKVVAEGKELAKKYKEAPARAVKSRKLEVGELLGEPDDEVDYSKGLAELERKKTLDKTVEELNTLLLGSDFEMDARFWDGMDDPDWAARTAEQMRAKGVSSPKVETILENIHTLFNEDGEARDVAKQLGKLLKSESYSEAINYIMEYISRVGLREASQDWKLAVLLRQQKDIISRINPDAAEAFEGRQHLRFLPSMSALPPEKYGEIGAQVTAKSPIDLILNPNNASMFAIQAEIGGKKLNISTAMYLDMLRSNEYSMRLLNADINSIDSTLDSILIERMWGKGAERTKDGFIQLGDGRKISLSEKVSIDYFDIFPKSTRFGKTTGKPQEVTIEELLNRGHWMLQDAQQVWWYSRIWEKHLANYPKEQMRQGPKKIASVGRMWGAYNAEYEKYARTMWEVAEIGSGLPPHEAYKAGDMIGRNVIDTLIKKYEQENPDRWNSDRGYREQMVKKATKIGKLFERVLLNRASYDVEGEKLEFVLDTLSLEEARLIGNTIDTSKIENILPYVRQRMLASGMKEREIPSDAELLGYANTWKNTKKKVDLDPKKDQNVRFWGAQIEEVGKWIDARKFDMKDAVIREGIEALELSDLAPFLQNEALVHGEGRTVTSIEDFFRGFEFSSVVNWAKTNHADDPFQYGTNYYQKSLEAGKLLNNVCNLIATREERNKLYETMQAYVAAPELRKFMTLTENRYHRSRTNQGVPYEVVAQSWTMGNDGKKRYSDSPNTYDFITLIDSEGKKWQVRTATGGRATMKTTYRGNFGWKEKGQYGERDSDVESDMRYWNAKGFVTKKKSEEMYEQVTGIHREVKWLFDRLGWHGATAHKVEHFVSHWGSKLKTILKKHPFFDDPVWAFWKILDEYKEFAEEVGKEIVKEVAH